MAKGFRPVSISDEVFDMLQKIARKQAGGSETLAAKPPRVIEYLAKKELGLEVEL